MPFETFVSQITAVGFQARHLTPFLLGPDIVMRHRTSRRGAPVLAAVR